MGANVTVTYTILSSCILMQKHDHDTEPLKGPGLQFLDIILDKRNVFRGNKIDFV